MRYCYGAAVLFLDEDGLLVHCFGAALEFPEGEVGLSLTFGVDVLGNWCLGVWFD
jgi:hypothetical protein